MPLKGGAVRTLFTPAAEANGRKIGTKGRAPLATAYREELASPDLAKRKLSPLYKHDS